MSPPYIKAQNEMKKSFHNVVKKVFLCVIISDGVNMNNIQMKKKNQKP